MELDGITYLGPEIDDREILDLLIAELYPVLEKCDVPFAQDCLGDQYILRQGGVYRLAAEEGILESKEVGLEEFLTRADRDPVQYLSLQPLIRYRNENRELNPGQLLNVYPPYCTKESARGVSIAAISMFERLGFLAEFSKAISSLPKGAHLKVVVSGRDPKDQ